MRKEKALVYHQWFDEDGRLQREVTKNQTVYTRANGTMYINHLSGHRTAVRDYEGRIVVKAGQRMRPSVTFAALLGDLKKKGTP